MNRFWMFAAALLVAMPATAAGFYQAEQSAAGAGVAGAFVASASDASAAIYNPSGMAWLDGVSVTAGALLNYRNSSVEVPAGIAPNAGTESTVGYLYLGWMPHDGRLGASFAFSPLYQAENLWGPAFGGDTKVMVDHAALDMVYAVSSTLAVSAGGDWYLSRIRMTQGGNAFSGKDYAAFGGHLSALWKPAPAWSLGMMLRSGSTLRASGTVGDELKMKLPDMATLGVAHDFSDIWRLEGDISWVRWSVLKDMNVTDAGGALLQNNPLNLRDTLRASLGLTWTWRPDTQFRFGYAYDQGANKPDGFHPLIADQDGHQLSIGAGGELSGMHLDFSYSYTFYSRKTATGVFAGTYRDRRQAVMISVSKRFE